MIVRGTGVGTRARQAFALLVVIAVAGACQRMLPAEESSQARAPRPISDSTFAGLVARISEPGGTFDTDNLLSNETAYLKVMGALRHLGLKGGAYVGVGPDQNFSYIALLKPRLAFIIDIRRDNLLEHLLLKALFHRAPTRIEYLAGLFGRPPPADPSAWTGRDVRELLAYIDSTPASPMVVARLHEEVATDAASHGIPLSAADQATIQRFHQAFIDAGPAIRFHSFGRGPQFYYPTYADLAGETDRAGHRASFLAEEQAYDFVRGLEEANRIIPVVGDLSGDHALREMGSALREMNLEVTAFYASNVEFYLWREGRFDAWAQNLASLPAAPHAVVIRSYFRHRRLPHPDAVPGYRSVQMLQPVAGLLEVEAHGGFDSYFDLVTRELVPIEPGGGR